MTQRTLTEFTEQIRGITERQIDFCGFCTMQACQRNHKLMYGGTTGERPILRVWTTWDAVTLVEDEHSFSAVGELEVEWIETDEWALQLAQHEHPEWLVENDLATESPNGDN